MRHFRSSCELPKNGIVSVFQYRIKDGNGSFMTGVKNTLSAQLIFSFTALLTYLEKFPRRSVARTEMFISEKQDCSFSKCDFPKIHINL